MISKAPGNVALYYQISEEIRGDLVHMRYGDKVPSETELMKRYNVSRGTIRQAITGLVNNGYLYKVHGKGTYRGGGIRTGDVCNSLPTFTNSVVKGGGIPTTFDVRLRKTSVDKEVAEALSIPVGETVWRLTRHRGVEGGDTRCYAEASILCEAIPHLRESDLELSLLMMITQKFSIRIASTTNSIMAVCLDDQTAKTVGAPGGSVALLTRFVARDAGGRPFLYDKTYNWDAQYQYVIESRFSAE